MFNFRKHYDMANNESNLFEKLSAARSTSNTIYLTLCEHRDERKDPKQIAEADTIELKVYPLTIDQLKEADSIMDSIFPPKLYEDVTDIKGDTRKVYIGYDEEDRKYLAERRIAEKTRYTMIALLGCKELYNSTEGSTTLDKAAKVMKDLPATFINNIAQEVISITSVSSPDIADFTGGGGAKNSRS